VIESLLVELNDEPPIQDIKIIEALFEGLRILVYRIIKHVDLLLALVYQSQEGGIVWTLICCPIINGRFSIIITGLR